jgi:hypothetical protein
MELQQFSAHRHNFIGYYEIVSRKESSKTDVLHNTMEVPAVFFLCVTYCHIPVVLYRMLLSRTVPAATTNVLVNACERSSQVVMI